MWIYLLKRLGYAVPTLLGLSLLIFAMVHLAPGDPALIMLGERASKDSVEAIRKDLGLDKPLYEQYRIFIVNIFQGDFGKSIKSKQPVWTEFRQRFPATLELTVVSMTLAVVFGIIAGIISAVKRYSFWDYFSMVGALSGVSMPVFWLGLVFIYIFSVQLEWLPVSGRISFHYEVPEITGLYLIDTLCMTPAEAIQPVTGFYPVDYFLATDFRPFWDAILHLILPGIALATIPMSIIARMTRASMREVLQKEYIKTAKAKGCSSWRVIVIHSLKNALIPVVTVIGVMVGSLLGGAVLTETVFSWPGIGKWMVHAVYQRDFPVIQCCTLILATLFIGINLFVDILYAFLNPEIRLEG
ncbi:MAG: ABC transporter permease [Planctomycetota bacterium]